MVINVRTTRINMDDDSRHLIEQKESQGRGLGIFATGYIPCGTRIVAESALLKISRDTTTDAKVIVRAFEGLSSSQKKAYLELHDYACDLFKRAAEREMDQDWEKIPELHRKVLGVWAANAFGSVFLLGSRINHSCTPNVNFAYNSALEKETYHAALIARGASAKRIAALQKSEGLLNRQLGISYHDAARYSARLGDANMALLWAEKELEVDDYCIGADHPDYLMELDTVNQLRKAAKSSEPFDQSTIEWSPLAKTTPSIGLECRDSGSTGLCHTETLVRFDVSPTNINAGP
ncbi:hypothetical protein V496_02447 [Pseudogymnoascus sp. VKM F-4515 (FW-2607)]|nr:hypothetical protein V496_02447 [Pseudogymnoascus sp. VKM F-4515 (FW-2607)]